MIDIEDRLAILEARLAHIAASLTKIERGIEQFLVDVEVRLNELERSKEHGRSAS